MLLRVDPQLAEARREPRGRPFRVGGLRVPTRGRGGIRPDRRPPRIGSSRSTPPATRPRSTPVCSTRSMHGDGVAAEIPAAIEDVTVDQPAAPVALAAAAAEPFHAYLLAGPPGSGKAPPPGRLPPSCSPAARRSRRRQAPCARRSLAAPRPGLAAPPGIQHLVEDVRRLVIAAAPTGRSRASGVFRDRGGPRISPRRARTRCSRRSRNRRRSPTSSS